MITKEDIEAMSDTSVEDFWSLDTNARGHTVHLDEVPKLIFRLRQVTAFNRSSAYLSEEAAETIQTLLTEVLYLEDIVKALEKDLKKGV